MILTYPEKYFYCGKIIREEEATKAKDNSTRSHFGIS